jgi:hypothetical protein
LNAPISLPSLLAVDRSATSFFNEGHKICFPNRLHGSLF